MKETRWPSWDGVTQRVGTGGEQMSALPTDALPTAFSQDTKSSMYGLGGWGWGSLVSSPKDASLWEESFS